MADDRKKALWPWTLALLIGLPVLYVASFGPACWASSRIGTRKGLAAGAVEFAYQPMLRLGVEGPDSISIWIQWWAKLRANPDWHMRGGCGTDQCYWTR